MQTNLRILVFTFHLLQHGFWIFEQFYSHNKKKTCYTQKLRGNPINAYIAHFYNITSWTEKIRLHGKKNRAFSHITLTKLDLIFNDKILSFQKIRFNTIKIWQEFDDLGTRDSNYNLSPRHILEQI